VLKEYIAKIAGCVSAKKGLSVTFSLKNNFRIFFYDFSERRLRYVTLD